MNIEDMIAYDILTKRFRAATGRCIHEITSNKSVNSTDYTTIATVCPKLKGYLGVTVNFSKNVTYGQIGLAIYDANNNIIDEIEKNSEGSSFHLALNIDYPLTTYQIKARLIGKLPYTITSIQLFGEVTETNKLLVPMQWEV